MNPGKVRCEMSIEVVDAPMQDFNCTPVDRASDSMIAPTYSYSF